MPHTRLRKFNQTQMRYYDKQGLSNDMCMAVITGPHIFLRGQTGHAIETSELVGLGDAGAQADQAMKNVKQLLEEAGSKLEHICKITVWITDRAYRTPVYQAIGRHLKGIFPVSTGIIVKGLAHPELMMEIDVDAVIPEEEYAAREQ